MNAQSEVNLVSDRRWLTTALCVVMGGWFGLQRFYLRRYAGGAFRLFLFLAAVYCGGKITLGEYGMIWRIPLFALLGAVGDVLMIALGPMLMRRRGLRETLSFYAKLNGIPFYRSSLMLLPLRLQNETKHSIPNIDGTWLTVPMLLVVLLYLHCARLNMPLDVKLPALGFIAFSVLTGVYWVRDCIRIFYWCNLTDSDGRLPL